MAKNKSWNYDSILARPVQDVLLLPNSFGEAPPTWFLRLGGSTELWKPLRKAIFERLVEVGGEIAARLKALCDHFGISQTRSGWERDLALSLARRHEPWVFEGPHVRFAELCRKLDVDPESSGRDLALQLGRLHVPGFRMRAPKVPDQLYMCLQPSIPGLRPGDRALTYDRLSTRDMVYLFFAAGLAREYLKHSGERDSDRRVAQLILNDPAFFDPAPEFAREVAAIVQNRGNRKAGKRGLENRVSDRVLREYLALMRTAYSRLQQGNASEFQRRYLLDALPMAMELVRAWETERTGQIAG